MVDNKRYFWNICRSWSSITHRQRRV